MNSNYEIRQGPTRNPYSL